MKDNFTTLLTRRGPVSYGKNRRRAFLRDWSEKSLGHRRNTKRVSEKKKNGRKIPEIVQSKDNQKVLHQYDTQRRVDPSLKVFSPHAGTQAKRSGAEYGTLSNYWGRINQGKEKNGSQRTKGEYIG